MHQVFFCFLRPALGRARLNQPLLVPGVFYCRDFVEIRKLKLRCALVTHFPVYGKLGKMIKIRTNMHQISLEIVHCYYLFY